MASLMLWLLKLLLALIGACIGAAALGYPVSKLGQFLEDKYQGQHIAAVFGGIAGLFGFVLGGFATAGLVRLIQ